MNTMKQQELKNWNNVIWIHHKQKTVQCRLNYTLNLSKVFCAELSCSKIPLAMSMASWHSFVRLDIVLAENSFPTKFDMMWDMVDGEILLWYIWITNFNCSGVISELDPFCATFLTGGWWECSILLSDINYQWFVTVSITTFSWNLQQYCSITGISKPLQHALNGVFDFSHSQVSITFITFTCCFVFFILSSYPILAWH